MTSGQVVKYKGSIDSMFQILCNKDMSTLSNGAGLYFGSGIGGAGV